MTPITQTKHISIRGRRQTITENYALIKKKDRAGSDGKNIKCPWCESIQRIYNLRWKNKQCNSCKTEVEKYEWMIDQLDTWKTPR